MDVRHDEDNQRREWRMELAAWSGIAALLLAALLGLLGHGPLSAATAQTGGLRLDYNRFGHYQGPEEWRFAVPPGPDGTMRLWLARPLADHVDMEWVDPWPARVETEPGRVVWTFHAPPGPEPVAVTFRFRPDFIGYRAGRAGVDGGPELAFWQFAYP